MGVIEDAVVGVGVDMSVCVIVGECGCYCG